MSMTGVSSTLLKLDEAFEHAIQTELALKGYDLSCAVTMFRSKDGKTEKVGEEADEEDMFTCEICDGLAKKATPASLGVFSRMRRKKNQLQPHRSEWSPGSEQKRSARSKKSGGPPGPAKGLPARKSKVLPGQARAVLPVEKSEVLPVERAEVLGAWQGGLPVEEERLPAVPKAADPAVHLVRRRVVLRWSEEGVPVDPLAKQGGPPGGPKKGGPPGGPKKGGPGGPPGERGSSRRPAAGPKMSK